MKPIRTGDLYLGNRWSIQSLLSKTSNSDTIWSEAGIFVVDNSDPVESEVYVYFVDQQVEKVSLGDLLAEGNLQSAAHRALKGARLDQIHKIEEFLRGAVGMNSLVIEKATAVAIPIVDGHRITSSGQKIDKSGRTLTHVSKTKSGYHSADLIASTLASAELILYNPQMTLSDLHEGSALDAVYGPENPLLPTSKLDRDLIIQIAQNEVGAFMDHYIEQVPQVTMQNVRTSRDAKRHFGKTFLAKSGRPGAEIATVEPNYIEQFPPAPLQGATRGMANIKAEDDVSKSLDRRLRKDVADREKFAKPKPSFNK